MDIDLTVTPEAMREALRGMLSCFLSDEDAEKGAEEAMADPELVDAFTVVASKIHAIAKRYHLVPEKTA